MIEQNIRKYIRFGYQLYFSNTFMIEIDLDCVEF